MVADDLLPLYNVILKGSLSAHFSCAKHNLVVFKDLSDDLLFSKYNLPYIIHCYFKNSVYQKIIKYFLGDHIHIADHCICYSFPCI